MKTVLYCFSGTGNSLFAARQLAQKLGDTSVISVNHRHFQDEFPAVERVGFIYPVYYGGVPSLMMEFIRNLSIPTGTRCFSLATKGGTDFISANQIDDLLAPKGLKLSYAVTLPMPGNCVVLYNPPAPEKQVKTISAALTTLDRIAGELNRGVAKPAAKCPGLLKALGNWFYHLAYRKSARDEFFRVTEKCVQCGICTRVCPTGNITLSDAGKPVWNHHCAFCLACIQWCPQTAIQFKQGTDGRARYHHPEIKLEDMFTE